MNPDDYDGILRESAESMLADQKAIAKTLSEREARELLRFLRSGYAKGPEAFDRLVLRRDPRTVRRWVSGTSPIPKPVLAFLYNAGRQVRLDNSEPVSQISDPINDVRD